MWRAFPELDAVCVRLPLQEAPGAALPGTCRDEKGLRGGRPRLSPVRSGSLWSGGRGPHSPLARICLPRCLPVTSVRRLCAERPAPGNGRRSALFFRTNEAVGTLPAPGLPPPPLASSSASSSAFSSASPTPGPGSAFPHVRDPVPLSVRSSPKIRVCPAVLLPCGLSGAQEALRGPAPAAHGSGSPPPPPPPVPATSADARTQVRRWRYHWWGDRQELSVSAGSGLRGDIPGAWADPGVKTSCTQHPQFTHNPAHNPAHNPTTFHL